MLFYYFYFIIKNAEHFYAFHDILKSVFTRIQGEADYEKTQKSYGEFLKRTRADHILLGFVLFLLADAAVIRLVEPDIHRYGDALWYCYAVISTAGFGDIVTVTLIGKICSVLLTIYTIFVVAIVTGVVVNFYTQLVEMQQKETLAMFMDKLERLPELSKEELEHISQKVRKFR